MPPSSADNAPDAYEKLIDRLLASPQYGERWGRHWLDVAGYADSRGSLGDPVRPFAYHYRDWVIRALNADKPLNEFIVEQLAGDELVPQPYVNLSPEQLDKLAATGFLRTAVDATGQVPDTVGAANQVVADTIKIVSSALLGLTVGCAQCHDHKLRSDPAARLLRPAGDFRAGPQPSQVAERRPAADLAQHRRGPGPHRGHRSRRGENRCRANGPARRS